MSRVPNVASVSELFILDYFVFVCLRPVSCAPNVASVSEFFILHYFALLVFALCLVCPLLPVSLGSSFLIAPSVFYNVYLFCSTKQTDAPFGVIDHLPEPMSIPRGSIEEFCLNCALH